MSANKVSVKGVSVTAESWESESVDLLEKRRSCLAMRVEPKTVPNPAKEYTIPLSILDVFPGLGLFIYIQD